ncbi:RICIN domain-containing protein [Myceligenerans xiligouense]|uniref:Glycosyl hydrolase family 43 n=1 Tax=Myceligenerans xiligouense TaxID=253184 RepID=A0A3N4ZTF2_9MICO|nr:RICIN domain-containing protein [Myceligenerans xiligouense]RPF23011.1 glycosyl hydrolase family 43 [Myceligenerans xiligouense]
MRKTRSRWWAAAATALALAGAALTGAATAPAATAADEPYVGYLFSYFTGEGTADGEQVYFGLSRGNDPLRYDDLNGNQPVLTSDVGTGGVRDPFIIRNPETGRFYQIATDLKIHGNGDWDGAQRHGSRNIVVWESDDLVNWTEPRLELVSPPTAGNTWAPEAYWDEARGEFVVFWASKLYAESDPNHTGSSYNRMMYATTSDFTTFSAAQVWIDPGYSVIDSTVTQHNGSYYRFTKDERSNSGSAPCGKFITAERATDLRDTSWDFVADCIGQGDIGAGEGPTIFKSNTEDRWYLFIDEFGGRGYVPFETTNLASGAWTPVTGYDMPTDPRHGTVLPVTQAEYDRLRAAFGGTDTVEPGTWYSVESAHSGLVWDIAGQSTEPGALLTQWSSWGGSNQQFRFADLGNGYHTIEARHSGLMLDVSDASTANGADVVQWTATGATNQQFQVRANGDGTVTFLNRNSGKALDLYDFATDPGARISQYTDNGNDVQKWILHAAP